MQWKVIGSDKRTGEDKITTIEASSEASARVKATAQGMYISDLAPDLSRAPAGLQTVKTITPNTQYPAIIKGNFWLGIAASIIRAFGILYFLASAACLLLIFAATSDARRQDAIVLCGGCAFAGAVSFGLGALLAFIGTVGLAVRDIAISSVPPAK